MNKCVICQAEYFPKYKSQTTCLHEVCKAEVRKIADRRQKARKQDREKRKALMTRGECVKEVDKWFSMFVRLRDAEQPCICCQAPLLSTGDIPTLGGGYDAGHFVTRSHMATRWDEVNVNAQRKHCNRYKGGNVIGYREGLKLRYGIEEVERLEALRHTVKKFQKHELVALAEYYKQKYNELKKAKA